jgi:hypothetical protein
MSADWDAKSWTGYPTQEHRSRGVDDELIEGEVNGTGLLKT